MKTDAPRPRWTTEITSRMRSHFALKFIGTSLWTWAFFIGYFHLLRHPAHPVVVMPLTALDSLIPFQPETLYAYLSLWLYVGVAPGLQRNLRELLVYGAWAGGLCATGLVFFYLWPTAVPKAVLAVDHVPGFQLLQGVDASGNACPSMHVAFAMFSALWIEYQLRIITAPAGLRVFNLVWFLAISWSTLAIRQHVVLDVLGGALLGIAFALPSLHAHANRLRRRRQAEAAAIIDRLHADAAS